MVKEISTR